jgi:small subunit ribosomal protein S11e
MSTGVAATVEQNQKAFQKQDCIFVGKKRVLGKKIALKQTRYYKSVGLGIKTPRSAIEGTYVDKKCPWTGNVNIRGKLITGVIKTTKMKNTIIIRKDYLHYIKKYNRFEKRHKNTPVHCSPCFRVKAGDEILAGQCRPLSKTVRFNMLKVIRAAAGGDKKAFTG